jgi:hypothetical protein
MISRGKLDSNSQAGDCGATGSGRPRCHLATTSMEPRSLGSGKSHLKRAWGILPRAHNAVIIAVSSEKVNMYSIFFFAQDGGPFERIAANLAPSLAQQSFAAAAKLVSQSLVEAGNRPAGTSQGPLGAILIHQRRVAGARAQFRLAGAMAQP